MTGRPAGCRRTRAILIAAGDTRKRNTGVQKKGRNYRYATARRGTHAFVHVVTSGEGGTKRSGARRPTLSGGFRGGASAPPAPSASGCRGGAEGPARPAPTAALPSPPPVARGATTTTCCRRPPPRAAHAAPPWIPHEEIARQPASDDHHPAALKQEQHTSLRIEIA